MFGRTRETAFAQNPKEARVKMIGSGDLAAFRFLDGEGKSCAAIEPWDKSKREDYEEDCDVAADDSRDARHRAHEVGEEVALRCAVEGNDV